MNSASQQQEAVCKAFWPAALLMGNVDSAEQVLMDVIGSVEPEDFTNGVFLNSVLALAIRRSPCLDEEEDREDDAAFSILPAELQDVLKLTAPYRNCFVLRFLLGLPEDECMRLLHVNRDRLSELTSAAVCNLAIAQRDEFQPMVLTWGWQMSGV